jgi:GNAT superfamily N-acetyltransferase
MPIRPAVAADTHTIAELIRKLAEYERLSHEVAIDEEDLRANLFGERRYAEVLLAEEAGEVVGFALFYHGLSTFVAQPSLYLEDIFVRPERRGAGHGRALLAELARVAVERGCVRIEWRVLDWNDPGLAFYRGIGAEALGDWTTYRLAGGALRALAGAGATQA